MMQTEQEKEGNEFWRTLLSGGGVYCSVYKTQEVSSDLHNKKTPPLYVKRGMYDGQIFLTLKNQDS